MDRPLSLFRSVKAVTTDLALTENAKVVTVQVHRVRNSVVVSDIEVNLLDENYCSIESFEIVPSPSLSHSQNLHYIGSENSRIHR